ncbi:MAG: hypothetical protein HY300_08485 [Verrucomicrobia bacterium]|nr:hypothetical protein [Verrucomicrobiota bacterium]
MNTLAIQQLRQKLAADKPIYGLWITLESPSITEMAVARGLDWVVVDAIGADGVVLPWIETAEQLRQAIAFANYPPRGLRGIGAERATAWGQCFAEHVAEANEHVLIVPLMETVTAGRNIRSLLAVPGVELFFFGPADYSATAGYAGQWEGPGVAEQLLAIKDQIRAAGKHCGVISTSAENLLQRREQGFQMLGIGADAGLLLRSAHAALAAVGRDRKIKR